MTALIQAIREGSEILGKFSNYRELNPELSLSAQTGDQISVLIREVNAQTEILKQFQDYRISNTRDIAGIVSHPRPVHVTGHIDSSMLLAGSAAAVAGSSKINLN